MIFLILLVAGVIATVAVVSNVAGKRNFQSSFLVRNDSIVIGLRTDVQGFGTADEAGQPLGFDRDVIDEVMQRLLPDSDKLYEYKSTTSQDAGGLIKYGEIDLALGLFSEGLDKTKGFTLTDPYYMDDVVAIVRSDSKLDSIESLQAGKVGIMTTATKQDDFIKYAQSKGLNYEVFRYTDYESAGIDIEAGRVNAIIAPRSIANQFMQAGFRVLAQPLYQVGYCVMLPTGQSAVKDAIDKALQGMEEDGTMQKLRDKWNL